MTTEVKSALEYRVIVTAINMFRMMERDHPHYSGEVFEGLRNAVRNYIEGMECPSNAPFEVKRAIVYKFNGEHGKAESVLRTLHSYGTYYGFAHAGMFHGVEPDGYIHT